MDEVNEHCVVVITGANTGVGRATALALASKDRVLILACRSRARTEPVLEEISDRGGHARFVRLELSSLRSVRRAANAIRAAAPRIDVLINNAAVAGARGTTEDGFELAFGVNHLGHFLLTQRLLDVLAPDARVVHLGSGSHLGVRTLAFESLVGRTRSLTGIHEYAVSKLCTMSFHHHLARQFAGTNRKSLAADPGDVASDAWRHVPWPIRPLLTRKMKPPSEGARTSVFCATDPSVLNGGCYVDCAAGTSSELARDEAFGAALASRSMQWMLPTTSRCPDRRDATPRRAAVR